MRKELIVALLIGVGIGAGLTAWYTSNHEHPSDSDITREGGYEFINPLLSCDISENTPHIPYNKLAATLRTTISDSINRGDSTRVSVYIRDMNTGHWTGVDPDGLYVPASLFKVPLMIAYLKATEVEPRLFQKPVTLYGPDENQKSQIKPHKPLVIGQTYALADVLRAMVTESDNNASQALNLTAPQNILKDVYGDIGLMPAENDNTNVVSPKTYMRMFRILYNSSYLERDESQQALELMARSTFTEGLVAGVPAKTVVAHKFGEREIYAGNTKDLVLVQLHDCGIVYYPRAPYGICVMTEGIDIERLKTVIAQISRTVYHEVNSGALTR